jgi:hypothetical protein
VRYLLVVWVLGGASIVDKKTISRFLYCKKYIMNNYNIDIGEIILLKLKEKDRTISWLAKKVGYDKSNLSKILKNSRYIYYELTYHISVALEEDFFIYGSKKLNEE